MIILWIRPPKSSINKKIQFLLLSKELDSKLFSFFIYVLYTIKLIININFF